MIQNCSQTSGNQICPFTTGSSFVRSSGYFDGLKFVSINLVVVIVVEMDYVFGFIGIVDN